MAEELGWSVEAFDEAFQEVFDKGMAKADFKARLVWLPNAIKHNKPESPNVVRSWRVELDLLPECDLKNEAISHIRETFETIAPSYVQAFNEVIFGGSLRHSSKPYGKPSGKASAKTMPNQEQEQEQEQEKEQSSLRSDSSTAAPIDQPADKIADRLAKVTDEAIAAYNDSPLTKRNGGNLPNVSPTIGREKRQAQVRRCLRVARAICEESTGSPRVTAEFWTAYFELVALDDFYAGRVPGGPGHEGFVPDFETLTSEKTMLRLYDRQVAA